MTPPAEAPTVALPRPERDASPVIGEGRCVSADEVATLSEALRESEARVRRIAEIAFEGIVISQDGVVVEASPASARMLGYDAPETMRGLTKESLFAPEARPLVLAKIAANDEEPYETILLRGDGTTVQVEARGRTIQLGGRLARVTAFRNVEERKAAERALWKSRTLIQESEAWLAEAQRVARIGSWNWDIGAGRIVWSAELFRIFEMEPAEGAPSFEAQAALYHPDDFAALGELVRDALVDGLPYEIDLRILRQDGSFRWTRADGRGEMDPSGKVVRLFGTLMDVHERKSLELEALDHAARLRRSEAELRAVLESAPIVLYATDADGIVTLSEGTGLAALGLKPGEAVGRSVYDFSGGDPAMEAYSRRALAGESVSFEARYVGLCLQTELRPVRNAEGHPTGLIGVCLDVTERVRSEERFRVLFERSSDAHLLFDETGIIDCNPAAVALLRCADVAHLLSIHPAALSPEFQPDGRRSDEKCVEMDALAHRNGFHRFEWTHRKLDGETFPVEVSLTPVMLNDRPALLVVWHDLTERKRAEREIERANAELVDRQRLLDAQIAETAEMNILLEAQRYELESANARLSALATTDGLTGLLNHRAFQDRLEAEILRSRRTGDALSVALLDVDRFKAFNDDHGHQAGDAVLRAVASALQAGARHIDVVARYGGEEFVVILLGAGASAAFEVAERLRRAVEGIVLDVGAVTASFGVATLNATMGREELIEAADQAMYRSKQAGRNRTTFASTVSSGDASPQAPRVR